MLEVIGLVLFLLGIVWDLIGLFFLVGFVVWMLKELFVYVWAIVVTWYEDTCSPD